MIPKRPFIMVALIWFLGWALLSLRFSTGTFRVLAYGRKPTAKQLKVGRFVGYLCAVSGILLPVEVALGLVPSW